MRAPRIRLRWRDLKAPAITLALAGALTMGLVATAPAPAQADDSAPQITDMTEQDYLDLGLKVDDKVPEDSTGPYSQEKKTTVVTRNEVYMAANGSHGNRYTLRDVLENVENANKGKDSKLKDDYGNIWGAAKFWQNVNSIDNGSDLYKQSNYGGGDWSHLSNNGSGTVLASQNSDFSGMHATSTELCLDASTGKDAYVAELRAYGDDTTTSIDGKSIKGKVAIKLFRFDGGSTSRTRTEVAELAPTVNSNMVFTEGGEFKYLRAGYLQELDAVFNIAAGDVDGDGVDEIFVYTGCYVDENDRRMAVVDMFDVKDTAASDVEHLVIKVDAGKAGDFNITRKDKNDIRWTQLQSCPVVTLAAGDLDRDFKDDLAITVSAPYAKWNIQDGSYCELYTWDDSQKALTHVTGLGDNGKIALSSGANTMLGASATFGTFAMRDESGLETAKTVTGLIVAGYDWSSSSSYNCSNKDMPKLAGYRFAYYDLESGELKLSDYQKTSSVDSKSGIRRISVSTYEDVAQDKRYPCTMAPIALCTANLDGLAASVHNDSILIGGDIYRGFACTVGEGANGLGNYAGTISMSGQHYNASNKYDHKGTDHVWISDVKAGCVSGTDTYRESFIAVVGSHRDEDLTKPDDYYWMTASHATLLANGTLNTGEEEVITESNRRNTRYGTFVSLALPDVDKDSVQIEYEQSYKVYTNPRVLAVLQDAPYYQDLQDAFGYLVLGGTGYGESKGESSANGFSISAEYGLGIEVETGAPGVVTKTSAEISSDMGYEYMHETGLNVGVTYESHAGEGDKAVIYTLPMVYHIYNATYEEYNYTQPICAPVALGAETSVVSTETYDRIAEKNHMTPLSYFLKNKSGAPTSYVSTFKSTGSDEVVSDSFGLGIPGVERVYSGGGFTGVGPSEGASVTQTIEADSSDTHSMEIGAGLNVNTGGGAKLGKHEFVATFALGVSAGFAHEEASSEGQEFEGTVDNLPEATKDKDYGFQWRLGVNKVDRDKFEEGSNGMELGTKDTDQFWIVGYDLREGAQTPRAPAVTGFKAISVDSSSVTLTWDRVLPQVANCEYCYGIGILASNASDATVSSWGNVSAEADKCEYTWSDNIQPNTSYSFVVAVLNTSSFDPVGIQSPVVTVKTMPRGTAFSISGPQANVGESAAPTGSEELRYDPTVTVSPGQSLTLTAVGQVTQWGEQCKPQYIWYKKAYGSDKWESVGHNDPEIGEPATLTIDTSEDKIDKIRGAQYYCQMGYGDGILNTSVTTINVSQSTLTTTNRTRPTLKRLAALFGTDARSFLDHSQVNTAGPAIEEPAEPSTPTEPTAPAESADPGKSDSTDKQAKATVTAKKTTAGSLSNTGDRTIATVAGIAVLGIIAIGAAVFLLRKNRR